MWTRDDALLIYMCLLKPSSEQYGFSAALYGSLLVDVEGNDLDVFMIPQRANPDQAGFINALRRNTRTVTDPIAGDWTRDVIVAPTIEGRLIDIQFTRL